MKGLTHFTSGLAAATFFQKAVEMASPGRFNFELSQSSFILVLGALFGILPDTLDFKMGQFFSLPDYDVDCNPVKPDPQKMAEQLGQAMDEAFVRDKMVKVQLYPMQLGADLWRQYVIKFDGSTNEVVIVINEIVSTSQVPFLGSEPKENRVGRYKLQKGKLLDTHGRPSVVDIMSGPQYGFKKFGDNVVVEFLPWHRTWSHSYILGLMLSVPVFLIAYLFSLPHWHLYGIIAFLGFAVHITEDLTGHMGGSLLWPLVNKRFDGLCLFKASDPRANFMVDYLCLTVIVFNLDRWTVNKIPYPWWQYFLYFLALPMLLYFIVGTYLLDLKMSKKQGEESAKKVLEGSGASSGAAIDEIRAEEESIIE